MKKLLLACACFALFTLSSFAAENPWVGTWKLDAAKSQFTGDTFTYSKAANGTMHYSDGSTINFDFGIDGKEYKTAFDRSTIWTADGDSAWNSVTKAKGEVLAKVHRQLSPDGKTLTVKITRTRPDGSADSEEDVYTRVTGTNGLVGKWRSTKVNISAAQTYVLSSPQQDVIRMEYPEYKSVVEGKADGIQRAVSGPDVPAGITMSFKMDSPTKMSYENQAGGKPMGYGTQTLSDDGKVLTDVSWSPGKESEKSVGVYAKQ
jgi:hypothetical protein